MFGNDDRCLKATLVEMSRAAWNDSLGKGVDPTRKLEEFIKLDSRFSPYDPTGLADEAMRKVRMGGSQNIDLHGNLKAPPTNRYSQGRIAR